MHLFKCRHILSDLNFGLRVGRKRHRVLVPGSRRYFRNLESDLLSKQHLHLHSHEKPSANELEEIPTLGAPGFSIAMDSSQAPLISSNRHDDDAPYDTVDDVPGLRAAAGKATDGRPGLFVLILTFAAGISGLLFGCRHFQSPRDWYLQR